MRILTAVAAYDGHDASVLALNRALLAGSRPVEVIYLGFNMTCERIVLAALQEGVHAVAVSSYNGGHLHFFPHLVHSLRERGLGDVLVFGGGGGTIVAQDAEVLEGSGVARIYGPVWSINAVAEDITGRVAALHDAGGYAAPDRSDAPPAPLQLARLLRATQLGEPAPELPPPDGGASTRTVVVAGDGGSGKSTLIDEVVRRFLKHFPDKRLAILANDPTIATGRADTSFLADRVRMNHVYDERVWLFSVATGAPYAPLSPRLPELAALFRAARFDLVLVETPGTGQSGLDLSHLATDLIVYVKTRESSGSPLQLQKDQLLRDADLVVLNKADLEGAESALGELQAALSQFGKEGCLFPATSKTARDPGVSAIFAEIFSRLGWPVPKLAETPSDIFRYAKKTTLVPHRRRAYLAEIAEKVRAYDRWVAAQLKVARQEQAALDPRCEKLLEGWQDEWREVSGRAAAGMALDPQVETVNRLKLSRVALPDPQDRVESLRFLLEEGLPGRFPFVTGLYPYRPPSAGQTLRQFAGLRGPEETNRRLHFLAQGVAKPRLSIAFDGITLYGGDSDDDPGSVGKIGEGGVAIDSWEDMKLVLEGFSIPEISTSMTINGPAPIILAMYFVAAREIEVERAVLQKGEPLTPEERRAVEVKTVENLRGTVQADILKEIQAQNENLFQPDFAVKLLGDIQEWFIAHGVKRFYSLSISGYHIGEAGATPVQELAFTLANGFTYLENFLSRGMSIDAFAPSLSFFFKVSHEAEWLAYGAVVRKIWAIALRDLYGGSERSQMLKFHTQTSGRALQAEEWDTLNPVRLTYHALLGLLANANSLHVDSADEPMTTPSEKWVRQATMISNFLREEAEGFAIQNLLSGSYAFRALVREVQEQVLAEFDRLDQLGGVGPATEQGYQRRCIAESSARYERERRRSTAEHRDPPRRKIVGYNAFELPDGDPEKYPSPAQLVRPDPADWERQLARVREFKERHREDAPVYLARLKERALAEENVFDELLETVRHATLGQISRALMEVGGEYRKMV